MRVYVHVSMCIRALVAGTYVCACGDHRAVKDVVTQVSFTVFSETESLIDLKFSK